MKNLLCTALGIIFILSLIACGQNSNNLSETLDNTTISPSQSTEDIATHISHENDNTSGTDISAYEEENNINIKITVNGTELFATLEDNSTTRALIDQMPMTISMDNLYGREMCYRYGADALPTDSLRTDEYEIGDIAYWPPRGSLVILYEQNGEEFERQHLGHITSDVNIFKNFGNAEVTFETVNNK